MYQSTTDGVRFIEGVAPNARLIGPIRVDIGGVIRSAQLKNLDDVKRIMAAQAKSRGGNAIVEFRYGQRSVGFWASLFQRDDVSWYGEGQIVSLP